LNEIWPFPSPQNTPHSAEFAFSDILKIDNACQAFTTFVTEITAVIHHISQLRHKLATAAYTKKASLYDHIFRTTVQETCDHFFATHDYAMECAIKKTPKTAVHLPYATQDQAFVRSLTDAMMVLRTYTSHSIAITHPWDERDWCIDRLVTLTTLYQIERPHSPQNNLHHFIEELV